MLRKNRKLPIIVGGLATVALLSVGFSTWILNNQLTNETVGNVSMSVSDVQDKRLAIFIKTWTNNSVNFDAVDNLAGAGTLITASTGATEDMTFGGSIVIGLASRYDDQQANGFAAKQENDLDVTTIFNTLTFAFSVDTAHSTSAAQTAYAAALPDGAKAAIIAPFETYAYTLSDSETNIYHQYNSANTTYLAKHVVKTANASANIVTIDFEFGFGYGTFFSGKNPVCYTDSNTLDEAVERLQNLHNANGCKFNLTVSSSLV